MFMAEAQIVFLSSQGGWWEKPSSLLERAFQALW